MTLLVEDGSGLPNSESYASVAYADAYFAARGKVDWAGTLLLPTPEEAKEQNLRLATDFMSERYRKRWLGQRATFTQALDWPRYDVPIFDTPGGYRGFPAVYPNNLVPDLVARACCELAIRALSGLDLYPDISPAVKSEKVGPIEVVYTDSGSTAAVQFKAVDAILSTLLQPTGFFRTYRT